MSRIGTGTTFQRNAFIPIAGVFAIFVLFSYAFEGLMFQGQVDITVPLALMTVLMALTPVMLGGRVWRPNTSDFAVLGLVVAVIFSFLFASDSSLRYGLNVLVTTFASYFVGRLINLRDNKARNAFNGAILILGSVIVLALILEIVRQGGTNYRIELGGATPIGVGEAVGITAITAWLSENQIGSPVRRTVRQVLGYVAIFAALAGLGARGAVLWALVTLGTVALVDPSRRYVLRHGLLLGMLVIVTFLTNEFFGILPSIDRFHLSAILTDPAVVGNNKFAGRSQLFAESIELFLSHPFGGAGLGVIYSHNIFLEILASIGLIGLLPFLVFVATMFRPAVLNAIRHDSFVGVLWGLFLFAFLYRQTSFALDTDKTMFLLAGMVVTQVQTRAAAREYVR